MRASLRKILFILLVPTACLVAFLLFCGNNPWPRELVDDNTLFMSVSGVFKTLDPAVSYYEHEYDVMGRVLEMPFEYHYLKRPYELIPMLAKEMPVPRYYDKDGTLLSDEASAESIGRVEYELNLKEGVLYQPHPCFAKEQNGEYSYLNINENLPRYRSPMQFPKQGTREMVAEDFKVSLTRLCDPAVTSPVYSTLKAFILGMDECSEAIRSAREKNAAVDYRQIPFAGVEATGKYTLKITLSRKYPQVAYWMAMFFFSPVPWEALVFYDQPQVRDMGLSFNFWPVGTGAFMMKEFEQNSRIIQVRNPNHRADFYPADGSPKDRDNGMLKDAGMQVPFIDTVYCLFEHESIPAWIKFMQGYYDINSVPSDLFDTTISIGPDGSLGLTEELQAKGISMSTSPRLVSYHYCFNMLDETFGGNAPERKKLRQAISIAIDCKEYLTIFANGRGQVAHGIIPPGVLGGEITQNNYNSFVFNWNADTQQPEMKPIEDAKLLMAEAGYPNGIGDDGKQLTLSYDNSSAGNPNFKPQFLWLKERLSKIGINLIDNGTDMNRMRDKLVHGNWQFYRRGWVGDYPDAENFLMLFYGPNAQVASGGRGANSSNYSNPAFDDVFRKLESMSDSHERETLIIQALDILREDAAAVWDYHPTSFNLTQCWLKNFKPHEVGNTHFRFRKIDYLNRKHLRK